MAVVVGDESASDGNPALILRMLSKPARPPANREAGGFGSSQRISAASYSN
jgi:hypothetical protein